MIVTATVQQQFDLTGGAKDPTENEEEKRKA
jgi:hypothetical protein